MILDGTPLGVARTLVMFSLLYGFWKYFFKKSEFQILIVGVDNAGKTVYCSGERAGSATACMR